MTMVQPKFRPLEPSEPIGLSQTRATRRGNTKITMKHRRPLEQVFLFLAMHSPI